MGTGSPGSGGAVDKPIVVIDAPSNLGLRPPAPGRVPGVDRMPRALRDHGIVERLGAVDGGAVAAAAYSPEWYAGFGVRNAEGIRAFAIDLAERVEAVIAGKNFPLVLGGDCSILLGGMLALRRRGRFGLVFLDGHLDFRHAGNAAHVGAAAGEDLALVTGRGAERLTDIDGLRPYVRDADVVALGEREGDAETGDILRTEIAVWDLAAVRGMGAAEAARRTVERLRRGGAKGFWIHLDADVLDDAVMPAVDSRAAGGLSYAELTGLVGPLLRSGLAVGMEVTIFDPDLDPDGRIAAGFTDALVGALANGEADPWDGNGVGGSAGERSSHRWSKVGGGVGQRMRRTSADWPLRLSGADCSPTHGRTAAPARRRRSTSQLPRAARGAVKKKVSQPAPMPPSSQRTAA